MTSAPSDLRYPESADRRWTLAGTTLDRLLPVALGAAVTGGVAAANGGYFPDTRAWASLGALWFALIVLVVRSDVRFNASGVILAGGLALFLGWTALSLLWTSSVTLTALAVEKLLVYVGVVLAALLVVKRRSVPQLLAGVLVGVTLVSAYALATRLLPERLGSFDPLSGYRLTAPVGYWNALGIFAGLGIVLALGFAARAARPPLRGLAAATLPLLMATFFFTFSRGAWLALAVGLVAGCVLDPRRLQLLAALLALGPWPALAAVLAYRSKALTTTTSSLTAASHQGHRLALWIVLLSLASATVGLALGLLEPRIRVPLAARRGFAAVLALAALAGLGLVWARWGSPPSLAGQAYDSLLAPPKAVGADVSHRLLNLSSNGRISLWSVAWHDVAAHPLIGRGAGTFQQSWAAHRPVSAQALDTHNLYLQTLDELGGVGLALLLIGLGAPLVAAVRARRAPLVPIAFAGYVAFLLHNAVDWDWELTGVGAAGVLCGVALVASDRGMLGGGLRRRPRIAAAAVVLGLAFLTFASVMSNVPLNSARAAADRGDWAASAAAARKAAQWAPWSSQPLRLLGEAQLAQENIAGARRSFEQAVKKDPDDWELWIDLGIASTGAEQRHALAAAVRLDPRDPTIRGLARRKLIHPPT